MNTNIMFTMVVIIMVTYCLANRSANCLANPPNPQQVGFVVIGAGSSGISSARKLMDNGYTDIAILEARHRIGGRMNTVDVPGLVFPIEEGCYWLQHLSLNSLYPITQEAGITVQLYDQTSSTVFDKGVQLTPTEVGTIVSASDTAWENAVPYIQLGVTVQEALVKGGYQKNNRVETYHMFAYEQIYGDNMETADSTGNGNYPGQITGPDAFSPGGYIQVLNYLVNRAPSFASKINYGMVVYKIDYSANNGQIFIYYNDTNTNTQKQLIATRGLILTVTLGVLKAGTIQFIPPLPATRLQAIRDLRFGVANKMALIFDSNGANKLGQNKYATNYLFRIGQGGNPRYEDPITVFINDQHVRGQPVLLSFVSGAFARQMETWTDTEILTKHMTAIREIIPNMPDPIGYLVTRWGSDPYALGVYTNFGRFTDIANFTEFQKPLGNKQNFMFAGEHTYYPEIGTANNAYDSGQFAAGKIIQAVQQYGL